MELRAPSFFHNYITDLPEFHLVSGISDLTTTLGDYRET